mgnify:CR=1 FL=1
MKKLLLFIAFILNLALFVPSEANAQSCSAPAVASGVTVEFPGCNGSSCDLTQASCAWNSQADAASYNVTVTEVETGTIIKNNESQSSSTTKVLFPITQGRTYKCDVVAVASCGSLAAASSDQLLCEADAIIDTPTPTTVAVPPTATPIPATPTIAPPGGFLQTVSIVGGVLIVIVGGILLFAL